MRVPIVTLIAVVSGACSNEIYEIPAGYKGWVEIDVANPTCPALRSENHAIVFSVGNDGHGCTAQEYPSGLNRRRYFYVERGERQPIPRDLINGEAVSEDHLAGKPSRKYLVFFIGPKSEMKGLGLPRELIHR